MITQKCAIFLMFKNQCANFSMSVLSAYFAVFSPLLHKHFSVFVLTSILYFIIETDPIYLLPTRPIEICMSLTKTLFRPMNFGSKLLEINSVDD
jgi:hypothetical protein